MVQTTEQYVLVHRAVRELFHEQLRVIDSHPYENIDLNGSLRTSPELENGKIISPISQLMPDRRLCSQLMTRCAEQTSCFIFLAFSAFFLYFRGYQ